MTQVEICGEDIGVRYEGECGRRIWIISNNLIQMTQYLNWWIFLVNYAEIQRIALNDNAKGHKEVVDQIRYNFSILLNKEKEQASKYLLALTKDEHSGIRKGAANTLGFAFKHVTDKVLATKYLLTLTKDEKSDVRRGATDALGSAFQHVTDKNQASNELLALTKDKDSGV